jgi:hypothetical protein
MRLKYAAIAGGRTAVLAAATTATVAAHAGETVKTRFDIAVVEPDRDIATTYAPLAQADPAVSSPAGIYGWGGTCQTGYSSVANSLTWITWITSITGAGNTPPGTPPANLALNKTAKSQQASCNASENPAETTDMDALGSTRTPLRDVLVHMIEEYARHCGHAGSHPGGPSPASATQWRSAW